MTLCSPFYVFKNTFQKQTNDNGAVEVKKGGGVPLKYTR